MLHIINGDGTAHVFKQTTIPADALIIWREILSEGPIIATQSSVEFWQARQQYIAAAYNEPVETYKAKITTEVKQLEIVWQHQEVVLWFEHDLLCQINLVYLLHWFAQNFSGNTAISLICIGSHAEKPDFRGLGELSPDQLTALFPQRQLLTPAYLDFGNRAWHAYSAPTPEPIMTFLQEDFINFPYLKPALLAHLTRFPSVQNGLNAIEQMLMDIIAKNSPSPLELFEIFWKHTTLYGIGDAQIVNYLKELEQGGLIQVDDHMHLTPLGNKVRLAEADYLQVKPLNRWLGGVHLQPGHPYWRWDLQKQQIIQL